MPKPDTPSFSPDELTLNDLEQNKLEDMGFEEKKPASRPSDSAAFVLVCVALAIIVGYSSSLVLFNNPSAMKWFAIHPPFQTLAVAVFAYGILTLQPTTMSQPQAKARGFARHQMAMFYIGFPLISAGSLAIIYNKYSREAAHFTSWHGTLGIIALAWMLLQIAVGGASAWRGGIGRNPKALYKYHRASGYGLLTLFLVVIHIGGAWSHFGQNNGSTPLRIIAFMVAPLAVLIGVISRSRLSKMQIF